MEIVTGSDKTSQEQCIQESLFDFFFTEITFAGQWLSKNWPNVEMFSKL